MAGGWVSQGTPLTLILNYTVFVSTQNCLPRIAQVILFDLSSVLCSRLADWKKDFFKLTLIEITDSDKESEDALVFGYLTFWLISEVCLQLSTKG